MVTEPDRQAAPSVERENSEIAVGIASEISVKAVSPLGSLHFLDLLEQS